MTRVIKSIFSMRCCYNNAYWIYSLSHESQVNNAYWIYSLSHESQVKLTLKSVIEYGVLRFSFVRVLCSLRFRLYVQPIQIIKHPSGIYFVIDQYQMIMQEYKIYIYLSWIIIEYIWSIYYYCVIIVIISHVLRLYARLCFKVTLVVPSCTT